MPRGRVAPDVEQLRRAHTARGPGRPRLAGWEREEQVYHLVCILLPAAWDAQQAAAGREEADVRAELQASPARPNLADLRWLNDRGAALLCAGRPWPLVHETLVWRLRLKLSTVRTYRKRSEARHRGGLCLLFGAACPVLGGLAMVPDSPADARWEALWKLYTDDKRLNFRDLPPAE